ESVFCVVVPVPRILEGFNLGLGLFTARRFEQNVIVGLTVKRRVKVNEVNALGGNGSPQHLQIVAVVKLVGHCFSIFGSEQRPVEGSSAHAEKGSDGLRGLPLFNQLPGVADLLCCEFWLAPEFHASALCVLHSGAGALADKAAL